MVAVAAAMRKVDSTSLLNRLGVVLGVVAGLLGWTGCGPEPIFAESKPIETEGGWSASDVKTFRFDITDTLSKHEFFIDLRHDQTYPFSNLYLFVDFDFPNGRQRRDTVLCELADARGAWLGTGSGPVVDHRIGFLSATAFPLSGAYEISVAHAMRRDPLPGVLDVGFRLERSPGQQD
jgi:gliding motility-associated lipoprotein GldH